MTRSVAMPIPIASPMLIAKRISGLWGVVFDVLAIIVEPNEKCWSSGNALQGPWTIRRILEPTSGAINRPIHCA